MPQAEIAFPTPYIGNSLWVTESSYIVYQETLGGVSYTIAVDGSTGTVLTYGIVDATVIQSALNALTAGRTWKEEVVLKGNFVTNIALAPASYTILELDGKVTLANGADCWIIEILNATQIEVRGGEWDGNRANQVADVGGFLFQPCTYVLVEYVTVHDIKQGIVGNNCNGIHFENGDHNKVLNCTVYNVGDVAYDHSGNGILFYNESQGLVAFNEVHNCLGGIYLLVSANKTSREIRVLSNYVKELYRDGISLYPGVAATSFLYQCDVVGNIIVDAAQDGNHAAVKFGSDGATEHCVVADNVIRDTAVGNYGGGISLYPTTAYCIVSGNTLENINKHGITIAGIYNTIANNIIDTIRDGGSNGINVEGNYSNILGNLIYNVTGNRGIRLVSPASYNWIDDNTLHTINMNGIDIAAGCICNIVGRNPMFTVGGVIVDAGTDTVYPSLILPFVSGTLFLSADGSAWGWEIDATTEYAIALGHLPAEVQQVVKVNVRATTLVAEADAMRLEINGYGGASNESVNQEQIAVANKPSATTNFAAEDYIVWTLTDADDADIGHLRGGDSVMFKVLHEVAGGADCATDAVFLCVEIQYA